MSPQHHERPLSMAEYQALTSFRAALRRFLRFSEQAARDEGLTPTQHQLLLAVKGHPGDDPPPLTALAESLQLHHHSASELVDRADQNGLVTRHTDPDDHRRVLVTLTAEGERHLAALTVQHREELRRFRQEMEAVLGGLDG